MNPTVRHKRPSLARRALPAIALTGASGFLLSTLDRPNNSADAAPALGDGAATSISVGGVTVQPTVAPTTDSTLPVPETAPTASAVPTSVTPVPAPAVVATAPPVASTVPPAPVVAPCQTVDGPVVDTRFGPVQVEASVSTSGQICSVDAIQAPNDRRRSVAINQYAVPILNDQVMAVQSANINGVSGATYTSVGYYKSLQAILDSLAG